MNSHGSTKKLVRLSLFSAAALIIFILEAQIPSLIPYIPGIKLGLANIITLFLLATHTKREALAVLMVRILLGSFFAGQMTSLIYSLAGGLLSFIAMCAVINLTGTDSLWFAGVTGGIFHNLGQILAAFILMQTSAVFAYIPYLVIAGIFTGLFTGICSMFHVKHFRRIFSQKSNKEKNP